MTTAPQAPSTGDEQDRKAPAASVVMRIKSEELFAAGREVEIEHHGRIYRLRLTNQNKLILTA